MKIVLGTIILHIMKEELFFDFKLSKYFTPPCLCLVLSHAKLKETNEETGLFSSFTQRKLG